MMLKWKQGQIHSSISNKIHSTSAYFATSETKTTYLFCISPYSHNFSRDRIFLAIRDYLLSICKELENRLHFDSSWRGYPTLHKRKISKRHGAKCPCGKISGSWVYSKICFIIKLLKPSNKGMHRPFAFP